MHKSCSKLAQRRKSFQGDFCFRSLCLLVKKRMSNFALRIHEMSNTNEKTLKKEINEPLHNALDFKDTELEAVKDSFQEVQDCNAHAQLQPSQIWMSSFSS